MRDFVFVEKYLKVCLFTFNYLFIRKYSGGLNQKRMFFIREDTQNFFFLVVGPLRGVKHPKPQSKINTFLNQRKEWTKKI